MKRFENKVALITGGTNGIGLATAHEFIKEGAKVIITGRSEETVSRAVDKLGPDASGLVSNAGSMADILELRRNVQQYTDSIDVLFVNAGYGKFASLETADENHFDELFDMLVKGTFFTVQQILPMINKESAIILNASSVTEYGGMPNFSVYTAAKSAVQSFVKTFAAECTEKNIRVNGISPGYIKTNIFNNTGLTPDQIDTTIGYVTSTLPFKRFGESVEVARTVLFLSSAEASYIHGATLLVDGGLANISG